MDIRAKKTEKFGAQCGFSLIELMVTLAIVGILSSIAIPSFEKFIGRARRAEMIANMRQMESLQWAFLGANDRFGALGEINNCAAWDTVRQACCFDRLRDQNEIGFELDCKKARYAYHVMGGGTSIQMRAFAVKEIVRGCPFSHDDWYWRNLPSKDEGYFNGWDSRKC